MPALDRNVKVTCGNCRTSVTKQKLSRHKSRCSRGTLYCTNCPKFSTKSRDDLNSHIAKKHATLRVKTTDKCKTCFKEFSGFYALRQHKTSEHGIQMKTAEFDVNNFLEVDAADLKEQLQACKHFLVDSELEKGRHPVFNFAMSTFDNSLINQNSVLVFKRLKCAAKINLAFGFILKNVQDGSCRYFYAHENNTVMEKSKLVCTPDDITNLKEKLQKLDIVDLSTRERANTKWKFCKLTILTVFAALLKTVPIGCKDSVLPEPVLKNQNVICLTFAKTQGSLTMIIFVFSEQLLCIYLVTTDWRRKHPKFSNFF